MMRSTALHCTGLVALLAALACAAPARAADILAAGYDAAADALVAQIAYRGTHPGHEFRVEWGRCSEGSPRQLVGRLIDRQGDDVAREDFRVRARIGLQDMPCRPALVTLRLGRISQAQVFVR